MLEIIWLTVTFPTYRDAVKELGFWPGLSICYLKHAQQITCRLFPEGPGWEMQASQTGLHATRTAAGIQPHGLELVELSINCMTSGASSPPVPNV